MSASIAAAPAPVGERLQSLDVFRGFTMFWLLGGKAFVIALAAVAGIGWTLYQLNHSEWEGLRYYDLIWPSFMLMVGVSIPFSFARRLQTQTRGAILRSAWRRAIVLFLLGSLRESLSKGVPQWIELSSALQPIAIGYLVGSHLAGSSVRLQIGTAVAILAGYAALLAFVPGPGVPAGSYDMNHNIVTSVDQWVLGRAHRDGWGTLLSIIPPTATTLLGLVLGQVLLSPRSRKTQLALITAAGVGCLLLGFALSPVVPMIMKLWTTSYAFASTGWACLLFAFFFWVIEVKRWPWWSFPLTVIGMNALAAYLLPTFTQVRVIVGVFVKPLAAQLGIFGSVLSSGAVLLAGWLILWWMHRRRIFLHG